MPLSEKIEYRKLRVPVYGPVAESGGMTTYLLKLYKTPRSPIPFFSSKRWHATGPDCYWNINTGLVRFILLPPPCCLLIQASEKFIQSKIMSNVRCCRSLRMSLVQCTAVMAAVTLLWLDVATASLSSHQTELSASESNEKHSLRKAEERYVCLISQKVVHSPWSVVPFASSSCAFRDGTLA